MRGTVAVAKEADRKKDFSPTDTVIHHVRDEHEMQLGSLGGVLGNIRSNGGKPSVESIAMQMSGVSAAQRAPALLALQQTHGNRYVQRVVSGIQAKLVVGQPGDKYEQEADRVADEVMRMPEPGVQRRVDEEQEEGTLQTKPLIDQITPLVQRQVEEESEEEMLQAKSRGDATSGVTNDLESQINAIRGGGQPLAESERVYFEPRFGADFSQVKVHTDTRAADSAKSINARAFTIDQDITFANREYKPESINGRRLLAHELTHTIQQSESKVSIQATTPKHNGIDTGQSDAQLEQGDTRINGDGASIHGNLLHHVQIERQTVQREVSSGGERVHVTQLKYVCIFVGYDLYGIQARRYVKTFMPDHHLIEASSMEGAFIKMRDHSQKAQEGGSSAHIAEVVLIAHGNASGFVKIPLIKGKKGITPAEMGKLQDEFKKGAHLKFQEDRTQVLQLFDESTDVIVRGCRVGRNQETIDALAAFFGGQATVYAAKEYQAFTRRSVYSFDVDPRRAAIKAFDHLTMQGFVPKEIVMTDDEKVRWVTAHLPDRFVPEAFLVDEENVEGVRKANADDDTIFGMKDFLSSQLIGVDKWGIGLGIKRYTDQELDGLSSTELIDEARTHIDKLRSLENEEPNNWRLIGWEAWWVLRCHRAWDRNTDVHKEMLNASNQDIADLYMPGLSYDTNLLSMQAHKRPDLKVPGYDAFRDANLVMPAAPPNEEVERFEVAEGQKKKTPPTTLARGASPRGGYSASKPEKTGELISPDEKTTPVPIIPEPKIDFEPGQQGGKEPETSLVVRGEFRKRFEIKYQRELGYLKVKRAVVEFNGTVDFKGDGEKELVIGALGTLSSKPGESVRTGGPKLQSTLLEDKDSETGVSGKVSGGINIGGQSRKQEGETGSSSHSGSNVEVYILTEIAWGPIAHELKVVILGFDETKSGTDKWTVLGIQVYLFEVKGDLEIPAKDGTTVKFTGTIKFMIEAEPNWVKIVARSSPVATIARRAAVGTGVTAEMGGAAASVGAIGEVVIAGGFAAGAVVAVYSYFKSVEEIQDLKKLERATDQGVEDFYGGYLAHLGINNRGGRSGTHLWKEGQRLAEIQLKARCKLAAHHLNEKYPNTEPKFSEDEKGIRKWVLHGVKKNAGSWHLAVRFSYDAAIRTLFYKTWLNRVKGTSHERNALYARAQVGLSSRNLADEPDYAYINAVGRHGAKGMPLPAWFR